MGKPTTDSEVTGEQLCKSCGMCCRGVFHPRAILYDSADTAIANRIGAQVIQDPGEEHPLFKLPCPAFTGLCSVFPNRPSVCQKHQCQLLYDLSREAVALPDALQCVSDTRQLLDSLLPALQNLADDHITQRPEALLKQILDQLPKEEDRRAFKKKHSLLLLQYGLFLRARDSHFYPDSDS